MNRRFSLVPIAAALLLLGCRADRAVSLEPPEPPRKHLIVLHTNDVHGQVLPRAVTPPGREQAVEAGGLVRLAEAVRRVRAEAGPDAGVLVLDGGDWFQGTPEGMLDGGRGFVRALAAVGYDAMALGNHEFDLGVPHLRALLDEVDAPVIAANLYDPETDERVDWVDPWRVVEVAGLRVGLIGLITPETPDITHPDARGLAFEDPLESFALARAQLMAAEDGALDLILPVGHIGIDAGKRLLEAADDVPLAITGHSHTYLREGLAAGTGLVVQAGDKATVLGRVDLWLEPRDAASALDRSEHLVRWKTMDASAELLQLEEPVGAASPFANAEVAGLCVELVARAEAAMGGVVGELAAPLTRGRGQGSTVAGNWISDLMRARTGADVAIHNRGGTRKSLAAGPVTQRDVYELLPFDNDLVTLELSGAQLRELVHRSLAGDGAGRLDFSGLRVLGEPAAAVLEVGGAPLVPERGYAVTTNSFLARGGDGYDVLESAPRRGHDPVLLRELVLEAFEGSRVLAPPAEERILVEAAVGAGAEPGS